MSLDRYAHVLARPIQKEVASEIARNGTIDERAWLAMNSSIPRSVQAKLSRDPSVKVRAWLASTHQLSASVESSLAADHEEEVRASLARNPSISDESIELLSKDNERVVAWLAKNSHIRGKLSNRIKEKNYKSFPIKDEIISAMEKDRLISQQKSNLNRWGTSYKKQMVTIARY